MLTIWGPCTGGTVVQVATVNGGGHGWPGINGIARFDGATEIGSFVMSVRASSQATVTLSAKLVSITVGAGKPRKVVVRLSSNLTATGRAMLMLGRKTVLSRSVRAAIGSTTVTLVLPARLQKGTYQLTVNLSSPSGTATLRRAVRVPR